MPLFNWLVEQGDDVRCENKPVNVAIVKDSEIDFAISYNYRHMIKGDVISLLPHRIINLHTSFLPYNKGADPNIWSFVEKTPQGVTIHEIDEGLDTGNILLQKLINLDPNKETLRTSYEKLHKEIQTLFKNNWQLIKANEITPFEQRGGVRYTKRVMPRG
jgi:methionyl-tRNA formyltransferase